MSYNNALKLFGLSSIYSLEELNFNNSNLIQRNYDKYCDRTKPEKCHLGLENIAKINLAYQILLPNAIKVGVSINRDENIYINNLCKALNLTLTKAHLNYVCDCAIGFNGTFREWLILEFQVFRILQQRIVLPIAQVRPGFEVVLADIVDCLVCEVLGSTAQFQKDPVFRFGKMFQLLLYGQVHGLL